MEKVLSIVLLAQSMDEVFAHYTLALIAGFVFAKWFVENVNFHLRTKKVWLHHWILAALAMSFLYFFKIFTPAIWGALCGIALEGLVRKNWSLRREN